MRFVVGVAVLWGTLAVLAEFPTTEPLAVALAWSVTVGVLYVYGDDAYRNLSEATA